MADEEPPAPQSIAQRIAALKLKDGGAPPMPGGPSPSYNHATSAQNNNTSSVHQNGTSTPAGTASGRPRPPPPPRPSLPSRPSAHGRTVSANVPTQNGANGHGHDGRIGNMPEEGEEEATVSRPALPPRTSTQQSAHSPALPPRRPSESPALSSRRASAAPSNYSLSRRESTDSMSSLATTRSGTSAFSNGDRYAVKAPAYDPTSLPPLPPKRTQEEREADLRKYQNVGAKGTRNGGLRSQKSMPRMQAKQEGTTPPPPPAPVRTGPSVPARPMPKLPARLSTGGNEQGQSQNEAPPPPLPSRTSTAQVEKSKSPPLPSRASTVQVEQARSPPPPASREMAAPPPRKSALTMGFDSKTTDATPPVPGRPTSVPQTDGAGPPPVPKGSRPDLAALQASKPKMNGTSTTASAPPLPQTTNTCLHCRDFSGPDNHAARFPRQSIPSQDVGWLAHQLTAPFDSLTDKARAIFTWHHHNIAYDTVAFFGNNVKSSTPQSTLASGLAVCEGYAGLFAALAMKAGLEAFVISGNSKGFGHTPLKLGQPLPAYKAGHAWNAVRIDGGEWKLIDPCWGSGNVVGNSQTYNKHFSPERFTQSNNEFGLDHFPGDKSKQFREDGRIVEWEEYITGNKNGCGADFFSGYVSEEGLDKTTFLPRDHNISLSSLPGATVRFLFQKICPHSDPVRNGRGPYYLYVLALDGLDGTQRNHVPFETNGSVWWCDVPVADLGKPGGKAQIYTVTSFDGGEGRGVTIQRYRERKGRCAMAFGGVCKWQVVA